MWSSANQMIHTKFQAIFFWQIYIYIYIYNGWECHLLWYFKDKPWFCWTQIHFAFANSVDPDQLASSEANCSGSALFVIKYVNLYQHFGSSNLIGWQLEVDVAS